MGVDPGTLRLGWAVIEERDGVLRHVDHGVIRMDGGTPLPDRLLAIHLDLDGVFRRHRPALLALEDVFVARNARSSLKLGCARGVVMLLAAQHRVPVEEFAPLQVKQAVMGSGRGGKEQVQFMTRMLLALPQQAPADAADAMAAAICGLHRLRARAIFDPPREARP
ncbi:MAG: Crossover junction endodeoxyribonuclease RuvC [Myxococcota bacterium]|nr:Crossover junction endodeoxyribonuclease RuvC [Myxococcota bacterium]